MLSGRMSGFSDRGDKLWAWVVKHGPGLLEWPLQGVFTLHVTDLQQRLASRAVVYRI